MAKLNFQQPLLQFSVSHDHLQIILICRFAAKETFLTFNVEHILWKSLNIFFQDYLINIKSKSIFLNFVR